MTTTVAISLSIVAVITVITVMVFNVLIVRRARAHDRWVDVEAALARRSAHISRLVELMGEWFDAYDLILRLEQGIVENQTAPSPAHAARADRRLATTLRAVASAARAEGVTDARWTRAWEQMETDESALIDAIGLFNAACDHYNRLIERWWCAPFATPLGLRSVERYQDGIHDVPIERIVAQKVRPLLPRG